MSLRSLQQPKEKTQLGSYSEGGGGSIVAGRTDTISKQRERGSIVRGAGGDYNTITTMASHPSYLKLQRGRRREVEKHRGEETEGDGDKERNSERKTEREKETETDGEMQRGKEGRKAGREEKGDREVEKGRKWHRERERKKEMEKEQGEKKRGIENAKEIDKSF